MKLLPIILLLLASSAMAKDYKTVSVHRHDKAIVVAFLPEFTDNHIQMLCVGDQKAMDYAGIDCYPAIPQPKPEGLDPHQLLNTTKDLMTFPMRLGIPESMY